MRISDWSSDVCSSDLVENRGLHEARVNRVDPDAFARIRQRGRTGESGDGMLGRHVGGAQGLADQAKDGRGVDDRAAACGQDRWDLVTKAVCHAVEIDVDDVLPFALRHLPDKIGRAHAELQSLMRTSYAVLC